MSSRSEGKQPARRYDRYLSLESSPEPDTDRRRLTGLDVTEGIREMTIDDNSTSQATSPGTASSSSSDTPRRGRQYSEDVIRTPRPRLRRKAATAPPGALHLFSGVSQPPLPRRAISARFARPSQSRSIRSKRQSGAWSAPLPRPSLYGTPASRSLISRRKSNRKSVGRLGLKPRNSVGWKPSPITLKRYQMISEALGDWRKGSLSERPRVKETLKNKKVEFLKTNIVDFNARDLPETPGSMVSTPTEFYDAPAHTDRFESCSETVIRRLPSSAARQFALSPDIQQCEWIARSNSALTVRTPTTPRLKPYKKPIYQPGPIHLEDKISATPRRASLATLDPFAMEVAVGPKRFSDLVALDGVVAYFQSLGVVDEAGEDGLDKFWVPNLDTSYPVPSPRRPTAVPPVPARPPPLSPSTVPSSSFNPPSPARAVRQDERQPLASPNLRRRMNLRRLLR